MRIALVSLDQCWEDKVENRLQCSRLSQLINTDFSEVDLIVYPEMTLTGFSISNPDLAEPATESESLDFFKQLSLNTQCRHIFGHAVRDSNDNHFNRCSAIDSSGQILAAYDKIHTFSYAGESELYARGDTAQQFEIDQTNIGLTVCFDLRFAELYAHYRDSCHMVINVANWPASRKSHWLTLLRARAIENQYFMIGVNRIGTDGNNMEYQSSSVVYDPLGGECAPMHEEEGLAIYDLDMAQVDEVRAQFPFINDRRNELYKKLG